MLIHEPHAASGEKNTPVGLSRGLVRNGCTLLGILSTIVCRMRLIFERWFNKLSSVASGIFGVGGQVVFATRPVVADRYGSPGAYSGKRSCSGGVKVVA